MTAAKEEATAWTIVRSEIEAAVKAGVVVEGEKGVEAEANAEVDLEHVIADSREDVAVLSVRVPTARVAPDRNIEGRDPDRTDLDQDLLHDTMSITQGITKENSMSITEENNISKIKN